MKCLFFQTSYMPRYQIQILSQWKKDFEEDLPTAVDKYLNLLQNNKIKFNLKGN